MPNKQITDLDPLVGGMDDTYNFWTQKDGGGAGSSFQMAWSKLFLAKDAAVGSDADGTSITIQAGAGDGSAYGGSLNLNAGDSDYSGGDFVARGGDGTDYLGGDAKIFAGNGDYEGGWAYLVGGTGLEKGGDVYIGAGIGLVSNGKLFIKRVPTSAASADQVYVDNATRVLKLKA